MGFEWKVAIGVVETSVLYQFVDVVFYGVFQPAVEGSSMSIFESVDG